MENKVIVGKDTNGIYYKMYKKLDEGHILERLEDFKINTKFDQEKIQNFIEDIEKSNINLSRIVNGK